jgi:hypothetical protein
LINELYKGYKNSAKRRKDDYLITKYEFKNFITENCYYCGSEPLKTITPSRKRKADKNGFKYNGIDRLENDLGYTKENCVTCCHICNNAKNTLSKEEFLNWVIKIYKYNENVK